MRTAPAILLLSAWVLVGCNQREVDPVYRASAAADATAADIVDWNEAYAWGDHADAGYLKVEVDPVFSASPVAQVTAVQIASWDVAAGRQDPGLAGYLTQESDPIFSASAAAGISATNIAAWNGVASASGSFLTAESDPIFSASAAAGISAANIAAWNGVAVASATFLTTEVDPVFTASPAHGIDATSISHWNTAYGWGNHAAAGYLTAETEPKVGSLSTNAVPRWGGSALQIGSITDTGALVGIGTTSPSSQFDVSAPVPNGTLDQASSAALGFFSASDVWQSFTAGTSGSLTAIAVSFYGARDQIALKVFSGVGTGGARLAVGACESGGVGYTGWLTCRVEAPPALAAGQSYTFEITSLDGQSLNVGGAIGTGYAGGVFGANPAYDLVFQTYVAATVSYQPALQVSGGVTNINSILHLKPLAAAPVPATIGDIYFDATNKKPYYYDGTAWQAL